jgi:hypothetical protein
VVTYLTSLLNKNFTEHDLLFWTEEELAAANEHKMEILRAFAVARNSTDPAVIRQWYYSGVPLLEVKGAPSRCAYYVSLFMVRAHVDTLKQTMPTLTGDEITRMLLRESKRPQVREDMWQALVEEEGLISASIDEGLVDSSTDEGLVSSVDETSISSNDLPVSRAVKAMSYGLTLPLLVANGLHVG